MDKAWQLCRTAAYMFKIQCPQNLKVLKTITAKQFLRESTKV